VFLTSYLAPTRRKLGIDVEHIRKVNPKIIYARGSGHGPKGPDADRPGYDALSWWSRGSLSQSAMDMAKIEWPMMGMVGHGDGMSGLVFAGGICAALLHRERTGEAKVVDSSLLGTAVWFNALEVMQVHGAPNRPEPHRVPRPPIPKNVPAGMISALRSIYQTSDYRFIYLLFLGDDDRDHADLCQRIGRPELASDARFAEAKNRNANSAELTAILDEAISAKPLAEWKALLAEARGAWTVVQTPEEILEDPQTIANGFMRHVDYPGGGLRVPIPAIQFDEEGGDPQPAPDFAEHTDEILAQLGCNADDIRRYRDAGTVA
jgi:crotonobetainyl-CoA:carnitine CoA-transferase CaiB-like acyl-CoA transferase